MEKDVYEQVQFTYRNCNKCICIHVFHHLVWKIIFLYMLTYIHVNCIYFYPSIWYIRVLQEPRPILFEIKKAWSRFLLETFKYQIHVSIFNVFNFVYMYNAKEDTCISTVSQHLIAVVLSEMRNNRN